MTFQFICTKCGKSFKQDVDSETAEVLLDALEAGGQETLNSVCLECKRKA